MVLPGFQLYGLLRGTAGAEARDSGAVRPAWAGALTELLPRCTGMYAGGVKSGAGQSRLRSEDTDRPRHEEHVVRIGLEDGYSCEFTEHLIQAPRAVGCYYGRELGPTVISDRDVLIHHLEVTRRFALVASGRTPGIDIDNDVDKVDVAESGELAATGYDITLLGTEERGCVGGGMGVGRQRRHGRNGHCHQRQYAPNDDLPH